MSETAPDNDDAKHNGYWLTPKWIKGFGVRRVGSFAVSRSTATHMLQWRGGDYLGVSERLGLCLRVRGWCCSCYVETRDKIRRVADETEWALAVPSEDPEAANAVDPVGRSDHGLTPRA